MASRFAVIIAGGRGERFWPQSRAARPKHLLPIVGDKPLLAQTLERIGKVVPAQNILVITSRVQAEAVREVCAQLPAGNVIAEPMGRDTAPAVALAEAIVAARAPGAVFAVLPADQVIHDTAAYQRDLEAAFITAEASPVMVTIGIRPTEPATGFGYIQTGAVHPSPAGVKVLKVQRFVEKPNLATAQQYLASGDYVWNAGMFIWSSAVVRSALAAHAPLLDAGMKPIREALAAGEALEPVLEVVYPDLQKISVDYALLEKSTNVTMIPASFDWDDVGSWPAVAKHLPQDPKGNVLRGLALVEQGANNIIYSHDGHLTAIVGADDLIVVHTADATLVVPKARAQEIKGLLKQIEGLKDGARLL